MINNVSARAPDKPAQHNIATCIAVTGRDYAAQMGWSNPQLGAVPRRTREQAPVLASAADMCPGPCQVGGELLASAAQAHQSDGRHSVSTTQCVDNATQQRSNAE